MSLARCSVEILSGISNFFNEVSLMEAPADVNGCLWNARSTCSWMHATFRPRPSALAVYGWGDKADDALIRLLRAFDTSSVRVLKVCRARKKVLVHILDKCPLLETLGVFGPDFQCQRYRGEAPLRLPRSLRHFFVDELPTRALASVVARLPRLELFCWSHDTNLEEGMEEEKVANDLQDEDLINLGSVVNEGLARRLLADFFGDAHVLKRIYDLSFRRMTADGLLACPWIFTSLEHVRISLDVLDVVSFERLLVGLLQRVPCAKSLYIMHHDSRVTDAVLTVQGARRVTVILHRVDPERPWSTPLVDSCYSFDLEPGVLVLGMVMLLASFILSGFLEELRGISRGFETARAVARGIEQ